MKEVQVSQEKKSNELIFVSHLGFPKREAITDRGRGSRDRVTRISHVSLVPLSLPEVSNNDLAG